MSEMNAEQRDQRATLDEDLTRANETVKRPRGRPVSDERRDPRIDVLVSLDLRRRVRTAADMADMRMGEWVKAAIEEKLARDAAPTPAVIPARAGGEQAPVGGPPQTREMLSASQRALDKAENAAERLRPAT